MSYITRTDCRVCGSTDLTPLFSLGEQYVNNFITLNQHGKTPKAPLELELCNDCTLVQLKHTAPQELLYSGMYWYRSGVTETMRRALRDITKDIEAKVDLQPNDIVLDIGSNDGTLLRSYTKDVIKVGVEPAKNLTVYYDDDGVDYFINDFWSASAYLDLTLVKPKVVTAIGMFYDLEHPDEFIKDVAKILSPDGLFVAQLMCLRNMIDSNDVGNICHEHLEFYSLDSLEYLFSQNGLEIVDIQQNSINGGSYRIYAQSVDSTRSVSDEMLNRVVQAEDYEDEFSSPEFLKEIFNRMEVAKKRCVDFVKQEVANGKRVWVYGASTKGNTILQYYGLDHTLIEAAVDRSPEKWGKYTVGTLIPIKSNEEGRAANPDYFLVLPYAFLSEFVELEHEWQEKGGKFIVPLPEFKVV